ncbi:MAG: MarR family transcriptional regulator [Ilumatobacter sp.]|nr:MarR family transcriptional regulator [Ilumatobacter sp.]
MTRWLDPAEDRAWRGLRRIDCTVLADIRRDLTRDAGLSDADYEVMTNLSDAPGDRLRSGRLAHEMRWSTSRLSHQLRRMEERGLVARCHDDDDGRSSTVELTPAGRELLVETAPKHLASVRRHLFDRLTPEQVPQLAAIVDTLLAAAGQPAPEQ